MFGRHRKKLRVINQSDISECGLACICMIANYHGYDISMVELREEFPVTLQGMSLYDLISYMESLHFNCRAASVSVADIKKSSIILPCILHWGMNHFVVLKSVKSRYYEIYDPATGISKVTEKEFGCLFTGVAVEIKVEKGLKFDKAAKRLKLIDVLSKVSNFKRYILMLFMLSVIVELFVLISPLYLKTVIDKGVANGDVPLLNILLLGFSFLLVIECGVIAFRSLVSLKFSVHIFNKTSTDLYSHLIKLPLKYFSARQLGDVISRFNSVKAIEDILTNTFIAVILDGILSVVTVCMMFYFNVNLTLLVLTFVSLYMILRFFSYSAQKRYQQKLLTTSSILDSTLLETVRAIKTLKIFQQENRQYSRWISDFIDTLNVKIRLERLKIVFFSSRKLIFGAQHVIIVYYASLLIIQDELTLGTLFAFMSYTLQFVSSARSLVDETIRLKMTNIHLERISDILFTREEAVEYHLKLTSKQKDEFGLGKEFVVEDLSFTYGNEDRHIFKNVSFEVKQGEFVVIVGPSGGGKTTLLMCLCGLLEATSGEIRIDDRPVGSIPEYRSKIATVLQEDKLLSGTIAQNIACFESEIDYERVYECARLVCILDEIKKMPMGFESLVGDLGSGLSSGQNQRIFIARALYKNPSILFMDEATANIELVKERRINENIKKLNITRIAAAHRQETIKAADKIIRLDTI